MIQQTGFSVSNYFFFSHFLRIKCFSNQYQIFSRAIGWRRVLQLLENLQHHYGEERYRPSSLLRQKALMEKHHEQ
ncbi:TPA: hypothetical protein RSS20_000480 [Klebsiella pneumoniae]|nr:hypothetical protein [Klebsiella pneumoniae]